MAGERIAFNRREFRAARHLVKCCLGALRFSQTTAVSVSLITTRRFPCSAALPLAPGATGPAVSLYESANTVLHSFIEAGIFAFCVIAILLYVVLRRIGDVALTLVPLLIAGMVTLELCVFFDLPLNFANIIALPLLLGVGVAFKIYYVEAWRAGKTNLLQSSLTRAIIFSALTTGTAFGSLWVSSNPGLSGMGRMMALALVCTLAAAVLFQQALLGPPRSKPGGMPAETARDAASDHS